MNGFFNRLLRINLTTGRSIYEEIPDSVLERTLGGKGLGTYYLLAENPLGVEPFSPENRFLIAVGPVTGTRLWSQSRFAVYTKSPATGGYSESYCGGSLAPKIKACGVDLVILEGACETLSTLVITDTGARCDDASALAGKDTLFAEDAVLDGASKEAGAMVIGPAGENMVAYACIKSDHWRSLGRGGIGAVMGSKNIKAIVFSGSHKAKIADEERLLATIQHIYKKSKDMASTNLYKKYGTISQVRVTNGQKCFPNRYWQSGYYKHWENLCEEYQQEHFDVINHGCPNCFLQCTKQVVVKSGRHKGLVVEGPEYETVYAIGGLNCLDNLEEVAYLNELCDRLGLDTMSAGNIAGLVTEASRHGRIDYTLDYNQPDRIAELFQHIARAEGLGKVLGKGIKAASEELGLVDLAVHVKGLEPAGFDPRVLKGMGLSYATAARGACHLRGTFYKAELSGQIPASQIEGKATLHIDYEDRAAVFDSLILCRFFRDIIGWEELIEIVAATTGMEFSKEDLAHLANRTTQATREFNRREGLGPEKDTLPPFLLDKPNAEGAIITRSELDTLINDYNKIRKGRYEEA